MIASNVIGSVTKLYNNTTNAELSMQNPTTITPDGVTFAVWGAIYTLQCFAVIYQYKVGVTVLRGNARNWLSAAFILNAGWLPFFAYRLWWLSLLTIIAYLFSLRQVYLYMKVDYNGPVPIIDKICGFAGVSMNMAWVVVALLLNLSIVFRNSSIVTSHDRKTLVGGNTDWAIACVAFATALACYHIAEYGDFVYALTTAWALFGIYRNQAHGQAIWSVSLAIVLCVVSTACVAARVGKKCEKKTPSTNELDRPLFT